ncbi:MAG: hypothetical protein NTU88_12325, partial [Armatimonadetes bacterium]|nr:hypothetical protein [Armatimonadota bacterium]
MTRDVEKYRDREADCKCDAAPAGPAVRDEDSRVFERIPDRLLWLSMRIIHYANQERPNPEKGKIGGHPASCASAVTILTALYFSLVKETDRIAVKPHASPVLQAAMYLLGALPKERLTTLWQYGGLQACPSRTKDTDLVDCSTGSIGLGAVAPSFAVLVQRYAKTHFGDTTAERFVAVSGDAELDEGNVWEAIIDEMPTEEYQSLIRSYGASVRRALLQQPGGPHIARCL